MPKAWFPFNFMVGEIRKDRFGEAELRPFGERSQRAVRVGKRFIFCRANLAVSARKRQVSTETCRFQLYSPYGELYAPSVRDICFASDMPAGVRGEYNITKTVGFNITFCVAKYITPSKTKYH